MPARLLTIRYLGRCDYLQTWQRMQAFTDQRDVNTPDELWLLEHEPVFTQGLAGKAEHVLDAGDIPMVQSDRGGQVTYHGPGQLVAYCLFDLRRLNMGIRTLVRLLERCIVEVLAHYGIRAAGRADAPGVYVQEKKICSIGLRVRRSCTYHGVAFNIDMDLSPFLRINPCGFQQLKMTQLRDFIDTPELPKVAEQLATAVQRAFNFS